MASIPHTNPLPKGRGDKTASYSALVSSVVAESSAEGGIVGDGSALSSSFKSRNSSVSVVKINRLFLPVSDS